MKTLINYVSVCIIALSVVMLGGCKDDKDELPKIDGYNNSGEVAKANLVAHWSFDNNNNEVISNTAPSNTYGTVASTTGQIGNGLQLTQGALVYPSISSIGSANSLGNYTVSLWVNVNNNGSSFTTFFGLFPSATTEPWGNLTSSAETSWFPARAAGDTLVLKANYSSQITGGALNNQDNRNDPRRKPTPVGLLKTSGQWTHFVIRFDATTHKLMVYANGNSIGAYDDRGTTTVALNMRTPAQAVIGSLAAADIGFAGAGARGDWMKMATASLDDIRVYNTAITDVEITALFNLGTAGR
jgi:hypothetical protein